MIDKFKTAITNILVAASLAGFCHSGYAATPLFDIVETKSSTNNNSLYTGISVSSQIQDLEVNSTISFPTPTAGTLELTIDTKQSDGNGSTILRASDDLENRLVLSLGKRTVFGTLSGKDLNYTIGYAPQQGQILINQNAAERPLIDLGDDGKIPPTFKGKTRTPMDRSVLQKQSAQMNAVSDISLLAVYTPEFAAGFNGDPVARINQMIAFANDSFARSGILIRLKLNRATQLSFPNNSGNGTLLSQLTNGSGSFSSVPQLRNDAGADMVTALRYLPTNSGSGVAWINGDDANFAYSVVQFSSIGFDSVFTHEIGHNLGSGHERASINPNAADPCGFNLTGYACGHGNQSANWGTVMSRLNSGRVNEIFSNPNLSCFGQPCGIPQGQSGQADNTTSFNFSRIAVSGFFADPVNLPPPSNDANGSLTATLSILLDDD